MVETCGDEEHRLYPFDPSTAAAAIYAVVFGILTVGHLFRMFRSKQWFMSIMVVGSGCKSIPLNADRHTDLPHSRSWRLRCPADEHQQTVYLGDIHSTIPPDSPSTLNILGQCLHDSWEDNQSSPRRSLVPNPPDLVDKDLRHW